MRALAAIAVFATLSGCGTSEPAPAPPTEPPEPAEVVEPTEPPASGEPRRRTVYVPAYSQLGTRPARAPTLFAITLSVRNVDPSTTITLERVDYFNTSGHRVRQYLDEPRPLRPLETAEFSVDTLDESGGSGANFLVYWEGASDAHPLLTETVMIGQIAAGYVSFTSRGVELERPPRLSEMPDDEAPDEAPAED